MVTKSPSGMPLRRSSSFSLPHQPPRCAAMPASKSWVSSACIRSRSAPDAMAMRYGWVLDQLGDALASASTASSTGWGMGSGKKSRVLRRLLTRVEKGSAQGVACSMVFLSIDRSV